jgi:fatty acid desaturase
MALILQFKNYFNSLTKPEHRAAWMIAVVADALQIAAFPLFAEGGISPADSLLDLIVAFLLIRLLGWHWAFLPTLAAELIPGADLFPTWTAAVWFVTRQQRNEQSKAQPDVDFVEDAEARSSEPEILPPGPAPQRR